ncbi:YopX family protein [Enterococcus avium]|uniref:YopX family protein n=2 Tax=Enterococcus avium TaxID=33945 RepID=UPI00288DC2F9|nr:YopX family protein [Enterococcus avium]MDT2423992.1 YopX family protein [Enterococcus avium]
MIPKFRAWWIQDEVMTHIDTLEFLQGGIRVSDGCWHEKFLGDEVILMQSTGLKDKNGVEIFEGDVVKISDGSNEEDSYTSVVKNYADEGYPAFDIEAPSSWYYESNILATIMGGEYETIEVIGNVWEDGDLINDSEGAEEN